MGFQNRTGRIIPALVVAFVFTAGIFMGTIMVRFGQADSDTYEKLKVFSEALSLIKANYVEPVNDTDLIYGAIRGMVSDLDPHSAFMPPKVLQEMQVETKGEFGGLGIQIGIKDRMLTVIAPIEDTPAYRAGIQAGDKIVRIDGEFTKDMTLEEAVDKMRGEKGTKVTISILREGFSKPKDYTITRDIIQIKSVKSHLLDGNIGYVRVLQFQAKTADELQEAFDGFKDVKLKGIILDLRNNPGGLLNMAVDVSGMFLEPGTEVVYIKGRQGEPNRFFTSDNHPDTKTPMVVLVNGGSASASEIVAGCLQDWGRAIIMGTLTFGKGSVQSVMELSDDSGLKITTAKYYTPKDRSIQNTGISPDIEVKQLVLEKGNVAVKAPHMRIRERDLEHRLDNETTHEDDNYKPNVDVNDTSGQMDEEAAPSGDEAAPSGEEAAPSETGEEAAPSGEEGAGNKELTPEQKELAMMDKDYQLQRAKDLLKGLSILEDRQAKTAVADK